MNFSGQFNVSIDLKGRISVPASFRDELRETYQSESIVVTTFDGGLVGFPPCRWKEICAKVEALPPGPLKDANRRTRIAPAQECSFNKQGRIQIPQSLRDYADLQKDAVVIGMFEKIEIWNKAAHQRISQDSEDVLKQNAQAQADIGF
ncbi:division/cell wall cluster transcriptional repressor MraZ [Malonomonas rubra]|uniref:division/cell wall cluster transcriptional repressor MraZ n=1 Tax=Malonomonas rubra TaxID=57040 RepID=UPI0026EF19D0|nr:division/cell wall cluster transcriptional repressor MraZ [Malonomonas rubra]